MTTSEKYVTAAYLVDRQNARVAEQAEAAVR